LLIVIVVIGILSAMMMLSSTEAVTSARASNIVSNLRNFKTAALAMYVDYLDNMEDGNTPVSADWVAATTFANGEKVTDDVHKLLVKYMNKGDSNTGDADIDHYTLVKGTLTKDGTNKFEAYFVGYNAAKDPRVREKLEGRAKSVGLLKTIDVDSNSTTSTYDKSSEVVYMFVTQTNKASS
ncbi:MAG: hypothetical protein IJG34_06685, partial [Synergistaceae bacterium]|nr:hypothetical protein [Synergistaceae bacterium]